MSRSTSAQKAERLNAAHRMLARKIATAEAAAALSRGLRISRRQAYRYLQQARTVGRLVPIVERSLPITFKIPADVIRDLRAYSAASGSTMSAIVTHAIATLLAATRKHG